MQLILHASFRSGLSIWGDDNFFFFKSVSLLKKCTCTDETCQVLGMLVTEKDLGGGPTDSTGALLSWFPVFQRDTF